MISVRHQTAIIAALYDAETGKARSAMNAEDLARVVGQALGITCQPVLLWKLVRRMVRNRNHRGEDRPDESPLHVIGCDSTGQSLVQLTGIGLATAKRVCAMRGENPPPLTPSEIAVSLNMGGVAVFA